jgi:hypothetical protein
MDLAKVMCMIMIKTYDPAGDQTKALQNIAFKAKLKAVRKSMEEAAQRRATKKGN